MSQGLPENDRSLEAELAPRDDDGRAADLDAVDAVALADHARVQRRRPADLRALRDLDLVAEADSPVAREMDGERPGGGARRGILRYAVRGSEHARLPARAGDREAVDARDR